MTLNLPSDQALYIYRHIQKLIHKSFNEKHEFGVIEVDFDAVKYCLGILKDHYAETRLMWKTIYLLFQYFEKYQNFELLPRIADVLYFVFFDTIYTRFLLESKLESDFQMNTNFPSLLNDEYELERHNFVWTLMRIPYRNDLTHAVPKALNLVWLAAREINSHRLLPILLRHGVTYMPPSSDDKEWTNCNHVLRRICCFTERHLRGFNMAMGFRSPLLEYKLDAQHPMAKRRIFTVFRAMDIVQSKMSELGNANMELDAQRNFIDRFRMIFDTIPEPIVTLREVRDILEKLFLPNENNKKLIDIFCEWFERLMPESAASLTPRPLKHLSRCQIRDNLRQIGKFPYSVYNLSIPAVLKEEILLEHWFSPDSFESENEELSFFEERDNFHVSLLAQQFFNQKNKNGQGASMLEIMHVNHQREIKLSSNKKCP